MDESMDSETIQESYETESILWPSDSKLRPNKVSMSMMSVKVTEQDVDDFEEEEDVNFSDL